MGKWMFDGTLSFNQDISEWDVSSVTYMRDMFSGASKFNQDLCSWGKKLPPSIFSFHNDSYGTEDMFEDSGCTFQQDPNEELTPFCASDCGIPRKSPGGKANWSGLSAAAVGLTVAAGLTS